MKELTLQELKEIELDILKFFDAFCRENNIKYYLSNGTLLGAIKYKGFIPWDDDIDVLVPRKDYDRLISLFEDNDQYQLFAYEKNNDYRYPFAKFCDMTTRKIEENINNGVDLGVDIDIFPLDTWNGNLEEAKKEVRHIRKNMFLLGLSKIKKADSRNPIKRFVKGIIAVFCKMKGSDYFIKRIIKTSRKTPIEGSSFVGGKAWCIYGECEIIPKSVFESTVLVEFEDVTFPAPVGYDIYLRSLYGDYREDPPIDKQKTHHSFTAYRL